MKKTIATAALTASSSLFTINGPNVITKNMCVNVYTSDNNVLYSGNCDETKNNEQLNRPILENGCAEDQTSIVAIKNGDKWEPQLRMCLSPNIVQL